MALYRADVEMLNRSLAGLGDTFQQNRVIEEQKRKNIADELLRQAMTDATKQHYQAEDTHYAAQQAHYNTMEAKNAEGHVSPWLQDPDGGTLQYMGPPSGYQQLMDQAKQNGRPLTVLKEPPTAKPQFGEYSFDLPNGGAVKLRLGSAEDLQKAMEAGRQAGAVAKPKAGFKTGPIANKEAWDAEQAKAAALEQEVAGHGEDSPEDRAKLAQAQIIRQNADRFFMPKPAGPAETETETEEIPMVPETPAIPAKSGFLGIGATPAVPGIPAQPKRTIRRTRPVGASAGVAPAASGANPGGAGLRQQAAAAIAQGKDPVAVKARFKQMTGQDL